MTDREDVQTQVVDPIAAKQGIPDSMTPTIHSGFLQTFLDKSLMIDELPGSVINQELMLNATSVSASQSPSGVDVPMTIEYGAAQNGASDPVEIDVNGNITFNETGSYGIAIALQFGRTGASGTSEVVFRSMVDIGGGGTFFQAGDSIATFIGNSNDLQLIQVFLPVTIPVAGTILRQEIIRDSNGHNSGGLFQYMPTLAGVLAAPSASIIIFRDSVA